MSTAIETLRPDEVEACRVRTVTLEFLRAGTAHNRLLSRDTQYLALCGEHEHEVVKMPFDHFELLRRLRQFSYYRLTRRQAGDDAKAMQDEFQALRAEFVDLRVRLIEMLGSIRGLMQELSAASSDADLVELRLLLSPAELALLPFEFIAEPSGPARELCSKPLVVIRRTRRVPSARLHWPHRPRILFAFASPQGVAKVPGRQHLLALRRALGPWLVHMAKRKLESESDVILRETKKYIEVLPAASIASIRNACQRTSFTHVHLLAHGAPIKGEVTGDLRYGIALHGDDRGGQMNVVDGKQLAAALRGNVAMGGSTLPAVMTLASCDSGNLGSVVTADSSVAYDLHDAGVPIVVASQFPLSIAGSMHMAETFYERLLWVDDPRTVMQAMRQALFAHAPSNVGHFDWASITAYGALRDDFAVALGEARAKQARQAADAAVAVVDTHVLPKSEPPDDLVAAERQVCHGRACLETAIARFSDQSSVLKSGFLASVNKRWAEGVARIAYDCLENMQSSADSSGPAADTETGTSEATPSVSKLMDEVTQALRQAADYYLQKFWLSNGVSVEALVQHLALRAFASGHNRRKLEADTSAHATGPQVEGAPDQPDRADPLFVAACGLARMKRDRAIDEHRDGSGLVRAMLELGLLANVWGNKGADFADDEFHPATQLRRFLWLERPEGFECYSLRRQLHRYLLWCPELEKQVRELDEILQHHGVRDSWSAVVDWRMRGGREEPVMSQGD